MKTYASPRIPIPRKFYIQATTIGKTLPAKSIDAAGGAAVDAVIGAVDEPRQRTGQECDQLGDVVRLPQPAGRIVQALFEYVSLDDVPILFPASFVRHLEKVALSRWGENNAGADRIDGNSSFRHLASKADRDVQHGGPRCAIVRFGGKRLPADHASYLNDSSPALIPHAGKDYANHAHHRDN